jgi:hypothetical protein
MGKINSKKKGSEYELKIAKTLSKWWGEEFHRTPMSGGLHWKQDNRVAGDIVTPPDSLYPFTTECKKREEWSLEQVLKGTGNVEKWWQQSVNDGERVELKPILIFSKNFAPNYLMLRYSDFVEIAPQIVEFNYFVIYVNSEVRVICVLEDFLNSVPKEMIVSGFDLKNK